MEVILLNRCCSKSLKELQKLCKVLESKGIKTKQRLLHSEAKYMTKYNITKEMLKNKQYIIVDSKSLCFPANFMNKSDISGLIKLMV